MHRKHSSLGVDSGWTGVPGTNLTLQFSSTSYKAQQKMQCALEGTSKNIEKVADVGNCSLLKKSLERDSHKFNAKDQEANLTVPKNSDQGCIFFTLVTLEPFALPLPGSNHRKHLSSVSQQKMDGPLVCAQPAVLFIDLQRSRRIHMLDPSYPAKPFPATQFSRPNILGQSRSRALTKATEITTGSCKLTSISSNVSSDSFHLDDSSKAVSNSTGQVKEISRPVKRSGKRKIRKKGKQYKKSTSKIELETVDEEGNHGFSFSETCAENDLVTMNKDLNELGPTATTSNLALIPLPQNHETEDFSGSRFSSHDVESKVSGIEGVFFDSCMKKTSGCDEISFDIFSDDYSPPVADSFSDCWNSDGSVHGETKSITITEENFGISGPDTGMVSDCSNYSTSSHSITFGTEYLSRGSSFDPRNDSSNKFCISKDSWSTNVADANSSNIHRTNGDPRSVALTKKGRRGKKSTGSSNGANIHGRTGKENNHSVWQKVRKHDGDEFIYVPNKNDFSQPDGQNRVSYTDSDIFLPKEEDDRSRIRVPEKQNGKPNLVSKFESNIHPRKGLNTSKTNLVKPAKINMYQKESSETSWQVSQQQPRSLNIGRLRSAYSQTDLDEQKPVETSCARVSGINAHDHLRQKEMHGDYYSSGPNVDDNRSLKLETHVTHSEFARQDNSELILQKWIPVGRKDLGLSNPSRTDNFLSNSPEESVFDSEVVKKLGEKELISNVHGLVHPTDGEVACLSPSFRNANFASPNDSAPNSSHRNADSQSNLDHKPEVNGVSVYGCDSNKIVEVVRDAYRFQLASEVVQLATGSPIAEFERLLRSASPALVPTSGIQPCKACSGDQMTGNALCRHQIPNISLGGIWQWYEKPGSYGLEVKGEDYHNSKRLGADRYDFRAYFVPYLSAVQLFRRSRSFTPASNGMANKELIKASEEDKSRGNIPNILSILLPKPRKEEDGSIPRSVNTLCTSDTSGSLQDDDSELLFEYFESEQPQQRRPLFEKIKELVRGDGCSNCQVHGDPLNLDRLDLHDLHPSSWYSVAWYPIYRIPDSNFRAAFLTYHSLGHFIHQSDLSDFLGGNSCVVSPVVGLQSYNTQGECWFLPKTQREENSSLDPSGVLKDRLRTLEQTAFTMARASVRKGDLKSVNKQPDFEFFFSRKRWT